MAVTSTGLPLLTVNAGSSSLKLSIVSRDDRVLASASLAADHGRLDGDAYSSFVDEAPELAGSAHRFVHGGPRLRETTLLTDEVADEIASLGDLAPLHNKAALERAAELRRLRPELPQIACFDTAFHRHLPAAAATYAVPWDWTEDFGIRRYGFHGLSHAWASRRTAALLGRPLQEVRVVSCHLGAGASLAAVSGGHSVDTTMGFTPNDGLAMATRSGAVDPGALLWLLDRSGLPPAEARARLEHESGLKGVSGVSSDLREVLAAADSGVRRAQLAIDIYLHRLRAGIAAMAAAMGGLDALTFTGGIGENSARVRAGACAGLSFLGIELDAGRNESTTGGVADVGVAGAGVRAFVVPAHEELEMASEARRLLGIDAAPPATPPTSG